MKPCEKPCPKCGDEKVSIRFVEKGERVKPKAYGETPFWCRNPCGTWYAEAIKEHLRMHCTRCQYEWPEKVLPKAKKVAAA